MIGIVGGGAFGTALAIALGREGRAVTLWMRDVARLGVRLPGAVLPESVSVTADLADLAGAQAVLLALPMQALAGFLAGAVLPTVPLVAC